MWRKIYFAILTAVAVTSVTNGAIVETSQGAVQGKESVGLDNATFVSYMGIPYARQPVGELRFQAPEDPEPWDGVLDGTTERESCIQFDDIYGPLHQHRVPEDEACLYLNVHVPSTKTINKAVFVFIHGGAYSCGSGNSDLYGPEYIVSKDVILVTFNYRLGLFGFLCLDIPEAPGNLAGRDMAAALRWVRRNIAAFGGDPDNVTVGGHSAGAASAQFVALSPQTASLFKRVIIMGGGGFQDWTIVKHKKSAVTIDFARKLNITDTNPKEVFDKLKSLDANEISKVGRQFYLERGIVSFTFVKEDNFDGVEPFLAIDPQNAITMKDNTDIDYMIGFNNREGIFPAYFVFTRGLLDYYNKVPALWVPRNILSSLEPAQFDVVGKKIKKFFIGDEPVTENNLEKFVDFCSSFFIHYGTVVTARLRSSVSQAPVYVYQFSYEGDYAPVKATLKMQRFKGVSHGDELGYIFKVNSLPEEIAPGSKDAEIRNKTLALWTNFMKYGFFIHYGTVVTARLRSSVSQAPVYVYQFSYEGDYAPVKATLKMQRFKGVSHGDELGYIFKVNSLPEEIAPGSKDAEIRNKTLALWTNFMKYGNPTPETNDLLPVKWDRTNGHKVSYYNIGESLTMEQRPGDEAVQFWDKLYQEYAPNTHISQLLK